jgi:hypothetical protein
MIYTITGSELIFVICLGIFFGMGIGQWSIERKYRKLKSQIQDKKQ